MSSQLSVVSLAVLLSCVVAHADDLELSGRPEPPNVGGLQRAADAIDLRASIAILRVQGVNERRGPDRTVRGRATVSVVQLLHGELPERFSVAYAYGFGIGTRTERLIWCDAQPRNGDLLLCIVVPNAYDPSAEAMPVVREGDPTHFAASRVIRLRGMDDPRIEPYRTVARLAAFAGTRQEVRELERASLDAQIEVRFYIADVIVNRIAASNPEGAKRVLRNLLLREEREEKSEES